MTLNVHFISACQWQLIQKGLLEDTNNNPKTKKVVPQIRADNLVNWTAYLGRKLDSSQGYTFIKANKNLLEIPV